MIHLCSVALKRSADELPDVFPFNVRLIRTLPDLQFTTPVTLVVGENGSGKSTLLEAIACAIGSPTVGSDAVDRDTTLASVRKFARELSLSWTKRTSRGFFLRAEDFFGFAKRMSAARAEALDAMEQVDRDYEGRSELAKGLAKMPHARTVSDLEYRYGDGLDAQSHGESFLKLFQSRLVPDGLYLLDEPEAPLSPLRQLAFLSLIKAMVAENCQFIIATHSPMILSFPDATILSCDCTPIQPIAYEDMEHVTLTREFLNDPGRYLSQL